MNYEQIGIYACLATLQFCYENDGFEYMMNKLISFCD